MAISAKITLSGSTSTNTGNYKLLSNVDSFNTPFETGLTREYLITGATFDTVPNNTTTIRLQSNNGTCSSYVDLSLVLPTATPTPTVTMTPTPTPTGYKYFLLLDRCDFAPGTETGWTVNSYTINQCTYGDIFATAGGFFSVVINSSLTEPSPPGSIQGSKNISGFTSCEDTPNHYIAPVYRTAKFKGLFRNSSYTSYSQIQSGMCGKDPSQFLAGFIDPDVPIYADPSVTGTTLTPGVLYNLYEGNIDGTPIWTGSGSYWWGAIVYNTNSQVDYIVRIESGVITEWRDCTTGNIITYP